MKLYIKYFLLCSLFLVVHTNSATAKDRSKLIVEIVVDGMRYDNFIRYSKNYSQSGFVKLANEGTQYSNARHVTSTTYPFIGMASLVTGATCSQHGIVGEGWFNYTTNKWVDMFSDYDCVGIGTAIERGAYSPKNIMVQTIGDLLCSRNDSSKVIVIGHDYRNAIIAGGSNPTDVYWLDSSNMWWATNSYYRKMLPEWLENFNRSEFYVALANRGWEPQRSEDLYVNKPSEVIFEKKNHNALVKLFQEKGLDYNKLDATPQYDDYLFEVARKAIMEEKLGVDANPDFLVLSFSGLAKINKVFGINSREAEDVYYNLDRQISELNSYLNSKLGKSGYTLVITGSSGTSNDVDNGKHSKSGRFNKLQFRVMMNSFLSTQFGEDDLVLGYENGNVYLNRKLIFEKNISLSEVRTKCATFALQFAGVAHSYTTDDIRYMSLGRGVLGRVANSFHPKFSGDVILVLLPNWLEIGLDDKNVISDSGSAYEYDVHVPLIFYGNGVAKKDVIRDIATIDIAPTICEMFKIGRTDVSQGSALMELVPVSIAL